MITHFGCKQKNSQKKTSDSLPNRGPTLIYTNVMHMLKIPAGYKPRYIPTYPAGVKIFFKKKMDSV
jgi:hypothetical protein